MKNEKKNDPRLILADFVENPYIELGRDTIDGVAVVGFESSGLPSTDGSASSLSRLWVDVQTELPVLSEVENYSQDGELVTVMTVYDFDWNIEVSQSDFEPGITDEYKEVNFGGVKFSGDDKSMILGLRFYSHITGGRYPKSLAVKMYGMTNEVTEILKKKAGELYPGRSEEEIMQKAGQGYMNLEFAVVSYGIMISQNKDAAYYGDKVTAENPDAVLMRWREDDGRYIVIFGDLTTKRVSEEALAELEAMPLE